MSGGMAACASGLAERHAGPRSLSTSATDSSPAQVFRRSDRQGGLHQASSWRMNTGLHHTTPCKHKSYNMMEEYLLWG